MKVKNMANLGKDKAEKFLIQGGRILSGEIKVRGGKKAATPDLAASLLTQEECFIDNLPLIEDVFRMIEVLKSLGAEIRWIGPRCLKIRAKNVNPSKMNFDLVSRLRSSVLLMGALIGRRGLPAQAGVSFKIAKPGGCQLGTRILDPHLDGFSRLGVRIKKDDGFYEIDAKGLKGGEIVMSEFSVTATENLVLAAVSAPGRTVIKCAAAEPYVQDLCHFLKKMGAKIEGIGTHTLVIEGKKLRGASHMIIPDPIEMGTFISLAGASKSELTVKNVVPQFIELELLKFKEAGLNFKILNKRVLPAGWGYQIGDLKVSGPFKIKAVKKVHNMPYPGFAADSIPTFALLMTQAKGVSLIHDWMYEARLKYVDELQRLGANAFVCDPHRALITGPTALEGKEITSFDLRTGATLILAGLSAKGETIINNAYQVDRGYERIEERLQKIGANIKRVSL